MHDEDALVAPQTQRLRMVLVVPRRAPQAEAHEGVVSGVLLLVVVCMAAMAQGELVRAKLATGGALLLGSQRSQTTPCPRGLVVLQP